MSTQDLPNQPCSVSHHRAKAVQFRLHYRCRRCGGLFQRNRATGDRPTLPEELAVLLLEAGLELTAVHTCEPSAAQSCGVGDLAGVTSDNPPRRVRDMQAHSGVAVDPLVAQVAS